MQKNLQIMRTDLSKVSFADPRTGGLTLTKVDGEDQTVLLDGAKFTYQFAPFRDSDFEKDQYGNVTGLRSIQWLNDPENQMGVENLSYGSTLGSLTTENGVAEAENLVPGWYKIIEVAAPEGYEKDTTPHYIAVTGDMAAETDADDTYHYADSSEITVENYETVVTKVQS